MISNGSKVKVLGFGKQDALYHEPEGKEFINRIGRIEDIKRKFPGGLFSGWIVWGKKDDYDFFYQVKLKKL